MIRFLLLLFSLMPLRLNHFIGSLIGNYLYLINTKSKLVVSKNIKLCFPQLTDKQKNILIKNSLINIGKNMTELGIIWGNNLKKNANLIKKINGENYLKNKRPIVILGLHFGCWEITGVILSSIRPITFLYKSIKNAEQEKLVFSKRHKGKLSMVTGRKGVFQLQKALDSGELIGIFSDQNPSNNSGMMAPFFLNNIPTMTLLPKIVRKNNAIVIMAWTTRLNNGGGYELNLKPVNILSKTNDLALDLALMNKVMEDLIKINPAQYVWNYKRFISVMRY